MKVLFAVSNENISTQIVKRYQKEYKEIISYKNMYYFNAIIKELQRDKSYDRIVISEDLEPFANNNYDEIEKFLFEKLDNITDEATGKNGIDIPIILLASDKRTKSESILVKLFGIGIYNVLLGQDRSTENVCSLLNKPRSKKEAKIYYKIESDEVNYKSESEDNVNEYEIKNILNHYRKLGKDEERYVESFNNIAAQYNDAQLRIITKFLPLNVKAVLEEKSPKYQSVMTFGDATSTSELMKKKKEEEGLKVGFLNYTNTKKPSEPVIVPTAVKKVATKKANNAENKPIIKKKEEINDYSTLPGFDDIEEIETENVLPGFDNIEELDNNNTLAGFEDIEELNNENEFDVVNIPAETETVKRGRGRPKKIVTEVKTPTVKRGRGRPKKVVEETEKSDDVFLTSFDEIEDSKDDDILNNFEEVEDTVRAEIIDETILPGFDEIEIETDIEQKTDRMSYETLPGFEEEKNNDETLLGFDLPNNIQKEHYSNINNSGLITKDKKIVSFVGTTKNGTSFLVNNLAKCLSAMGIKTAILDLTLNRNSYYIYTKNQEKLRNKAYESIKNLRNGIAEGITVDKYLDVYTALPGDKELLDNPDEIITTLVKNYSIVLMDCDFNTLDRYFEVAQELYIVQTMDIFTIQPMTAFLRDLKAKNLLEEEKIRIIINKEMRISGLTPKVIIGGLSKYNDPAMSFMTGLFDVDRVKYCVIPFDERVYSKYLEGVMNCEVTINSYPKNFRTSLKKLANMVYPLLNKGNKEKQEYSLNNNFSSNMNNTLEQMRNKY